MCTYDHSREAERYSQAIIDMHERLNFRTLLKMTPADSTYHARRPSGLLTLGVRSDELSSRHRLALHGFRLAQYLQLGWVCKDLVAERGMFCEPSVRGSDLHVVTVSPDGFILGYLGLVGTGNAEPRRLDDPERTLFPVEKTHMRSTSQTCCQIPDR